MTQEEKTLFLELCHTAYPAPQKLKSLLSHASPTVLGWLFWNRMQGIAYGVLEQTDQLKEVPREFKNALQGAYQRNIQYNTSYCSCLNDLFDLLHPHRGTFAMLKGAVLCQLYPAGYRTGNDIDLLVRPQHITAIGQTLLSAGFRQGYIRGNTFRPATRKQIIQSKMMRGETVPYIKKVDLPYLEWLEVDINFSLDYQNGSSAILDNMLRHTSTIFQNGVHVVTLDPCDFFLHLCAHLYKEATTLPWIQQGRDMTLYKFSDIAFLLDGYSPVDLCSLYKRAKEWHMDEICSAAILWTASLLPVNNQFALDLARQTLAGKDVFLNTVISPQENKTYQYTQPDIRKRFFSNNRLHLLKEI